MYTITLALAAAISGKPHLAVVAAASGVLIGWPFSVLAVAPIVIYCLFTGGIIRTILVGLATCIGILVSVDHYKLLINMHIIKILCIFIEEGLVKVLFSVDIPLF